MHPTTTQTITRAIFYTLILAQILAFTAFYIRDTRSYRLAVSYNQSLNMNNDTTLKELISRVCFEGVKYNGMGQWNQPAITDPLTPELCEAVDALVSHIKINY